MAALGNAKSGKFKAKSGSRRVSPLKPGLRGIRNFATAQLRAASYSKAKRLRLIWGSVALAIAVLWGGLWLGGFIPDIQAAGNRVIKKRLVAMGFVVEHVDVVGEGRISEAQVRAALGVRPGDFLFDMDIETAQARVQNLSWVETAVVRRLWPNRIVVHINERRAYALWQVDQTLHVIDKEGVVITDARLHEHVALPLVVGQGANAQAAGFLDMLNANDDLKLDVSSGVYVGNRRWDIVLADERRILLPAHRPDMAMARLSRYHARSAMLDLDIDHIDLRLQDRIYIAPRSVRPARERRSRNTRA